MVTILCQGTVAFSSDTGDRMALTMVEQLVNTSYQKVGYYDQRTDNLTFVTNTTTGEQGAGAMPYYGRRRAFENFHSPRSRPIPGPSPC